jgi:hypothetical protein
MKQQALQHISAAVSAAAAGHFGSLSTGEKLAAALVLNRGDWLAEMGYSIAEAIERLDDGWAELLPCAARQQLRSSQGQT